MQYCSPSDADPSPPLLQLTAKESGIRCPTPPTPSGELRSSTPRAWLYQPVSQTGFIAISYHRRLLLPPLPGTFIMPPSSKPGLNPNTPSFHIGKSPGTAKSQSRLNFSAVAKQKTPVVSIEKKVINTKIGRAPALSNSSAVKKSKGSDGVIHKPNPSSHKPPSPVNAAVCSNTKSNKRVQITSPQCEPNFSVTGSPVSPPHAKNVYTALDGNSRAHLSYIKDKVDTWTARISNGHLVTSSDCG